MAVSSSLACELFFFMTVCMCVPVYILLVLREFKFLFDSVLLWPGSCELMRALLSPCLNSSVIQRTYAKRLDVEMTVCLFSLSIFSFLLISLGAIEPLLHDWGEGKAFKGLAFK